MRICHVTIENFRNFRNLSIQTGSNLILVGANATGKSNFIHALRLILDPALSRRDRRLTEDDFYRGDGEEPWKGRIIRVVIELTDFSDDPQLNAFLQKALAGEAAGVARLTYEFKPRDNVANPSMSGEFDYDYRIFAGGDDTQAISEIREHLNLSLIPALRNAEADLLARNSPMRRLFTHYQVTPPQLTDVTSALRLANDALKLVTEVTQLSTAIGDRLKIVTEQIHDLRPSIQLLSEDSSGVLRALRLMVEGGYPIASTSLGLSNVLYMTLCMLEIEARERIRRPLMEEHYLFTILAIEEPEAHIHPHLQRLVFRDFLKRTPLILSTHSPYIASVANVDSIIMFRKPSADECVELRTTAALRELLNDSQRAKLSRYLDNTRAELLFARAVLLVEGDAEALLIPQLAKRAGYDLDRYGITVCCVGSTDFEPFVQLCGPNGLDIPYAILTDGDKYARMNDGLRTAKKRDLLTSIELLRAEEQTSFEQRTMLQRLRIPHYFGLQRCLNLLESAGVDSTQRATIQAEFDQLEWAKVIELLADHGLFVNEWSFEPKLIQSGFAQDLLEVMIAEDIGPRIQRNLEAITMTARFSDEEIETFVRHIDIMGKGRIAKRFEERLIADQVEASAVVPSYICEGVAYLVNKLAPASGEPSPIVVTIDMFETDLVANAVEGSNDLGLS